MALRLVWIAILLKHRKFQILRPMPHPGPLISETTWESIFHKPVLVGTCPFDWTHPCLPWHHNLKRKPDLRSSLVSDSLALNSGSTAHRQSMYWISPFLSLLICKMGLSRQRAIGGWSELTDVRHLQGYLAHSERCMNASCHYYWYRACLIVPQCSLFPNQPVPKTDGRLHHTGIWCSQSSKWQFSRFREVKI